jgi:hypothetical protein
MRGDGKVAGSQPVSIQLCTWRPNKLPKSSTHADLNCVKISSLGLFNKLNVVPNSIATALSHLLGKRRAARQPTMATAVTPATAVTSAAAMTPATTVTSAAAVIASNTEDASNSRVFTEKKLKWRIHCLGKTIFS